MCTYQIHLDFGFFRSGKSLSKLLDIIPNVGETLSNKNIQMIVLMSPTFRNIRFFTSANMLM